MIKSIIFGVTLMMSFHCLGASIPGQSESPATNVKSKTAYSGEDHPAVPAITTQFFSMSSPFALGLCKVKDYFL